MQALHLCTYARQEKGKPMNSVIFKPSPETSSQAAFIASQQVPVNPVKRDLFRALRLFAPFALGVAVVVSLLVAAYAFSRRPSYVASALVYVQPEKSSVVTDPVEGAYDSVRYDSFIQQQIQTITREDTLSDALLQTITNAGHDGHNLWIAHGETLKSAATRLGKSLKVERETGSYQVSIALSGTNPQAVADLVNAVVASYIAHERKDELGHNELQLAALRKNRVEILDELNGSTFEQAQLSKSLGIADPAASGGSVSTSNVNPYDAQLAQLRTELAEARASRAVAEAQLASVSGGRAALNAAAAETFANDPGLSALKENLNQRKSALSAQMASLTPKNPLYKQNQDELNQLDKQFDGMSRQLRDEDAAQVLSRLRLEAERREDIEARLSAQLQGLTSSAATATPKLQRAASVTADVARLQARFTEVDNAIHALELVHDSAGLVHSLLVADPPAQPNTLRKWLLLAAALPFGIFCGIAAAFLRYRADPRVYVADDISHYLGFPPIATLPDPADVEPRVTEEFMLRLVAGIDQAHTAGEARAFVFSAVSPGTNITDMVAELARRMERLGYRVMIKKASAALDRPVPTADRESIRVADRRISTVIETGPRELRRGNLLAENLIKLTQSVDLLFIEALPFASSAETEFIARLADITVLVPESAITTRQQLSNTLALARRINVGGIAAVLINLRLRHADAAFLATARHTAERQADRQNWESTTGRRDRGPVPVDEMGNASATAKERRTSVRT